MKKLILILMMLILATSMAIAEVAVATTSVYVRSVDTGEIRGSLAYGDRVRLNETRGGWAYVQIGGETYKVYADYVTVAEGSDGCRDTIRKQGNAKDRKVDSNGVVKGSTSKHKIREGSEFSDVYFW